MRLRTIWIDGAQSGKVGRPRRMSVHGELSQLQEANCQSDDGGLVEKVCCVLAPNLNDRPELVVFSFSHPLLGVSFVSPRTQNLPNCDVMAAGSGNNLANS